MLFNSLHFLFFFPVAVLLAFALKDRARILWLIAASCYFYMAFGPAYAWLSSTSGRRGVLTAMRASTRSAESGLPRAAHFECARMSYRRARPERWAVKTRSPRLEQARA